MHEYAEVIIDLVSHSVDRPFHYHIPSDLREKLKPGMQVTVPLGSRQYPAYITRLLKDTAVENLRDIIALNDSEPLLTAEQLALVHWLALRCFCRKVEAVHAMIPTQLRKGKRPGGVKIVELTPIARETDLSRAPAQEQAVQILKERGPLPRGDLVRMGVRGEIINTLGKKGLVRLVTGRPAASGAESKKTLTEPHQLREEQAVCFERIKEALDQNHPRRMLLHGVTASGKTEIYMQSIAHALQKGRTALVLVPEISLTPQMIEHFAGRFPGLVAILHSRLTAAEKNRQWQMILDGEARVVLGARSAVFAPLDNLGVIIIDEEHETTYKQEESPRYHARDVASWRIRYHGAVLILGSATPSLESYYRAREGKMELLNMKERVTPSRLPPVEVVDMRREIKENHRHIFSRPLLEELNGVVERDEQALLFINRRGFAGFVLCRECGFVVRCPSCDVSLTLHMDRQVMCCHYCAREEPVPQTCPGCGGTKIRYFSAGTQRVEDEVRKLYPSVSFIRMDSDTTSGRRSHDLYYRQFRDRTANILIGTQMIAKGFDFPDVTLVGVVAADTTLNLPDFRAPERTFQLLTQVAGRTARGSRGGKVLVQTYHPLHYSILAAAKHDYQSFFEAELENRRQLDYPPFSEIVRFLFSGDNETTVFEAAAWLTDLLESGIDEAELLGPAPASLYRIKGQYRVQTIVKGKGLSRLSPVIKKLILEFHDHKPPWPVRLAVDFNPMVVL